MKQDASVLQMCISRCEALEKRPRITESREVETQWNQRTLYSIAFPQHLYAYARKRAQFFLLMVSTLLSALLLLCPSLGAEEQRGEVVISRSEVIKIPPVLSLLQQGYTWRDEIEKGGSYIRSLHRDFSLKGASPVLRFKEAASGRPKNMLSLTAKNGHQWLQKRYKELYGLSHERHNQRYEKKRRALSALYHMVIQNDRDLQRKVFIVEKILAPLTLSDVLLALAKAESNYDNLAIGAHGEASVFQLTPRFAYSKGLKIYHWEKYLEDSKRYGRVQARQLHTQDLQELIARYQEHYPTATLLQELAKEDDRFNPRKVMQIMISHLAARIKWLQEEEIGEILPLVFIGHNGGIGRLKRLLNHLRSRGVSLAESYSLLSRRIRLYTNKLIVDLALTRYQRLVAATDGYF